MGERRASNDGRAVAAILRGGLALALVGMILGVAIGARHVPLQADRMTPFDLSLAVHPGASLAMIGILVLGATPAVRVGALVVLWAREHDRRFTLTALAVAAVLVLAAILGKG